MKHTISIYRWVCATLVCVAFVVFCMYVKESQGGLLKVFFLDVGQGDAIYIRTPRGHDMLIDGGPNKIVIQRLSEVMPWYDKTIDVVLETHPDADHIGGLPQVLTRYHVGLFIEPGVLSPNAIDDEILRLRSEKNIDRVLARRGMFIDFGDGAHFDVLYPDIDPSSLETNTASIVGKMIYGLTAVMLTGDSPKVVEDHLVILDGVGLRSDILKAGHHGSHSSSGKEYVSKVSPKYAVISSGKDNRYGHPHKEVIDILTALGIDIVRTDTLGTITFFSDGKEFREK
jgi:competence protein ComEC